MSQKPKTITLFLSDGKPNGIREVELSNRIIKTYVIPRALLKNIKDFVELQQPALYLLFNTAEKQVYIGESENFYQRIKNHDQKKDFWDLALTFIAKDNSLEKGDVKYLESIAVKTAQIADRFKIFNTTIPKKNNLHKFKEILIEELFEDIRLISSTLGYPLFDSNIVEQEDNTWFCTLRGALAKGVYNEEGFTLLAGSILPNKEAPSLEKSAPQMYNYRQEIKQNYITKHDENRFILTKNITFNSPSYASTIAIGASSNGWTSWKNKQEKTLHEIVRLEN